MRFVGNYALRGLSPQTDGMPVILTVVKTSTASDVSRKPALAKLVAVPTNPTALAVSTEADIAWYVASAISVALRPVSVDSCNISLLSLFNDTLDVSAIVPTLATPLPKSDANFADPANTPPATADILEKLRPAFSYLIYLTFTFF